MITERQTEILVHIAHGMTYKEVGASLYVSAATVRRHLSSAYERLGVQTATAHHSAIEAFRVLGWLHPPELPQ